MSDTRPDVSPAGDAADANGHPHASDSVPAPVSGEPRHGVGAEDPAPARAASDDTVGTGADPETEEDGALDEPYDDYDEPYDDEDYDAEDEDESGWNGAATRWDLVEDDEGVGHLVLTDEDNAVAMSVPIRSKLLDDMAAFTDYFPEPSEHGTFSRTSGWAAWSSWWQDIPASSRRVITIATILIFVLALVYTSVLS